MSNNNDEPLSDLAQSVKLGKYKHFKGHPINVIGVARYTEDYKQEYVVYEHGDKLWVRPVQMFLENVDRDGYKGPRFIYLG